MKLTTIFCVVAALLASTSQASELTQEILTKQLRQGEAAFEYIDVPQADVPVAFDIRLGESTTSIDEDAVFDGFRFVATEGAVDKDFVWYFNAPANWGHWYIMPMEGDERRGFRGWLYADRAYEQVDEGMVSNRLRVLQTLPAGYFEEGKTYLMWFRRTDQVESPGSVRGVLSFTEPGGDWDHDRIEKALGLIPADAENQVKHLRSKGGEILLDKKFFKRDYATQRIDDVLTSLRRTRQMRGGFFITLSMASPPCNTQPSFATIRAKYGEPDFMQTAKEHALLIAQDEGVADDDVDNAIVTYYYDYFGFEVSSLDREQKVLRVVTHANDFSVLRPKDRGAYFAQMPMKNLTVLHRDNEEVGRLYFFLEGEKEPRCILEPPEGKYRMDDQELEYLGKGEWIWKTYFEDGGTARVIPLRNHQMNGLAKGFYRNGDAMFVATYKDGLLDGEVIQYPNDDGEPQRTIYQMGRPMPANTDGEQTRD